MTGKTGITVCPSSAMIQDDIAMGHFSGPRNFNVFIIVALTALKTLRVLSLRVSVQKSLSLVFGLHLNSTRSGSNQD